MALRLLACLRLAPTALPAPGICLPYGVSPPCRGGESPRSPGCRVAPVLCLWVVVGMADFCAADRSHLARRYGRVSSPSPHTTDGPRRKCRSHAQFFALR